MPRTFLSALLLLIVGIVLSRDAAWQPLLNEASAENVIQVYLGRYERVISCDCAMPTSACEQVCRSLSDLGWQCGTPAIQADAEIRQAMESGVATFWVAGLIQQHPDYPFETRYVVLDYSLEPSPVRSR